jgi:murein L,D-transpeptidase YcbB/YkuD
MNLNELYTKCVKRIDAEFHRVFDDDDVRSYIERQVGPVTSDNEKTAQKEMLSLMESMSSGYYFAFEYAPTRNMGISLFSINNELKKQNTLLSRALAENSPAEVTAINEQITELEKRYTATIKQINALAAALREQSVSITLADREREYYEYKSNTKKHDQERDAEEERDLIEEKVKENRQLGLDKNHGLESSLESPEHSGLSKKVSGAEGEVREKNHQAYIAKLKEHRRKIQGEQNEAKD